MTRIPVLLALTLAPLLPAGAADYVVTEWASDPAIAKTVAISIDDQGRAYVTAARRRKESSLDIRHHQDLVKKDLSLTTVEDRREWYKKYLTDRGWVPDRNGDGKKDWRDLTVQKDSVIQVSDSDGDGVGDALRTLGEFHTEVTGISAGVLAVGSDVFVAAEPDFLRYHDKDGDGWPETEQLVATGFQVHMGQGGHNLSGVTLGPDGRVYWSLGDKGHYVETAEGKTYHMPNAGGIFRCELDGTMVERYSSGERNAQELGFDAYGNLFSMDNDGDYPGEKERALYITEGSEHGWRLNWQWLRKQDFTRISGIGAYNPWMDEKLFLPEEEHKAAYLTPTIGNFGPGPCGFTANPGTALSPELSDCFFMTNQQSQVRVFRFKPKGAAFEFEELDAIKGGTANTGLAIGPDGALYSASYGGKRGSIFRFDVAEGQAHPQRAETLRFLQRDVTKVDAEILIAWLDHPDQRVRMKGQFELVRRKRSDRLQVALQKRTITVVGKLHALWGIGMLARTVSDHHLIGVMLAWEHDEPEVLAQAAKVIGETDAKLPEFLGMEEKLLAGLGHESPRVQFFSAIALGNHQVSKAAPALVKLLAEGGSKDPYLRHAAVMGLKGAMTPGQIAALATHENRNVRLGAIVALRKLAAPEIRAFLKDEDELVLLEAARAIHDDASIPDALADLSDVLKRDGLKNEALMRRVINAAFRHGSGSDLENLASYLERGEGSSNLRRTALASILWWSEPPVLDAVEGRYRKHAPRDAAVVNAAVLRLQPAIAKDSHLREVLLNGVNVRTEAAWLGGMRQHFAQWPADHQLRLLDALAKVNSPDLKALVIASLDSENEKLRQRARQHAERVGISTLDRLMVILDNPEPAGQGAAVLQLADSKDPAARIKLVELAKAYRAGEATPEWKLELWQAAQSAGIELPATPDRLEYGGDPARGRKLAMGHAAAQCVRCHKFPGAATAEFTLGPDLRKIGAVRDRAHLVTSMLEPLAEITEGFGTVLITTKSSESISGVLTAKADDEWTVTLADTTKKTVKVADIASHIVTSLMPPMGALMKPAEIRDVVSYLAGLK